MKNTYNIQPHAVPKLVEVLQALSKRAVKLGLPAYKITVRNPEFQVSHDHPMGAAWLTPIDLEAEQPKLNGWSFVATIHHLDTGNVVRALPGAVVNEKYNTVTPWCEHCKLKRKRNDSFVVRHESGEECQVGRSCLEDFTGHDNPHALAKGAELLAAAMEAVEAAKQAPPLQHHGSAPGTYHKQGKALYDLRTYLALVARELRVTGWRSKKWATHIGDLTTSTSAVAFRQLVEMPAVVAALTEQDKQTAVDVIAWAENLSPLSDYEESIVSVVGAGSGAITEQHTAIAAAAVHTFSMEQSIAAQQLLAEQGGVMSAPWVGSIGDKITLDLRYSKAHPVTTAYGKRLLLVFATHDNKRVATWVSPHSPVVAKLHVGNWYKVSGRVTKHETYKTTGEKRTIISAAYLEDYDQGEQQ